MMKYRHTVFLVLLLNIGFTSLSQEQIYIPFFNCEGCDRQIGISTSLIFTDFINEKGNFEAILAQKRDPSFEMESFNEAKESAEVTSSKYFVMGTMVKLESTFYLKISMYATSTGLSIWSTTRLIYDTQDIPVVLKDIVSNLGSTEDNSQPGDINLVSASEGRKVNRIRSNKSIGFLTGAMIPLSEKEVNHLNPGFGGLLAFDLRSFILETTAEVYFAKDSLYDGNSYDDINNRYYNLNINSIFPLATTNSTPFLCVGTGFSYRESEVEYYQTLSTSAYTDKMYDQGFTFNGGGGYILKRNSDATLFMYAKGYVYMPDFDTYIYGVMLNFAIHIEGW